MGKRSGKFRQFFVPSPHGVDFGMILGGRHKVADMGSESKIQPEL